MTSCRQLDVRTQGRRRDLSWRRRCVACGGQSGVPDTTSPRAPGEEHTQFDTHVTRSLTQVEKRKMTTWFLSILSFANFKGGVSQTSSFMGLFTNQIKGKAFGMLLCQDTLLASTNRLLRVHLCSKNRGSACPFPY